MDAQLFAQWFTLGVTVIILMVDAFLYWGNDTSNSKDTISSVLRHMGRKVYGIPYVWGVLAGHFWSPTTYKPFSYLISLPVLLGGLIIAVVTGALINRKKSTYTGPLMACLFGVPFGVFFWSW